MENKSFIIDPNMNEKFLQLFDVNKDAIYTNRGFYYQYLNTLKCWISNYIENKDVLVYTEVDNDIKEVGEVLYFKQIKCYTGSLSFSSKELQKAIFDFFILHCRNQMNPLPQRFCFSTNTSLAKREKLLHEWIKDPLLEDDNLKLKAQKRIQEVLSTEFKSRKNKKLSTAAEDQKSELQGLSKAITDFLNSEELNNFVERLEWEFIELDPITAIAELESKIIELLKDKIFSKKSPSLLMSVLLSEIYKRSQNIEPEQRSLSISDIDSILSRTDSEIEQLVDKRLVELMGIEFRLLKNQVLEMHSTQENHTIEIEQLKKVVYEENVARELTFVPEILPKQFIGRKDVASTIDKLLDDHSKIVIHGVGGIGKTTLVANYVAKRNNIDHLIWITVDDSIVNSFILENILLENLKISFQNETPEVRFNIIANSINKIPGNNLIVVDMQSSTEGISLLKRIKWPQIIITRQKISSLPSVNVDKLSFSEAKTIYLLHNNRQTVNDEILLKFFEYINYNTLVIELTAKTIEASYDLTLESFLTKLLDQNLDDYELEIDIDGFNEQSVRIYKTLRQTFDIKGLESKYKQYLEFLALLPSTNIVIEELILICGKEHFDMNKVSISNYLNTLEKKGWIEFSKDRKRISIHRIIQEMIIYTERENNSPFITNILYITWLTARLVEGTNNPSKSFNYLKYAESILAAIKEKYRYAVYQPLLLLENELLYLLGFYYKPKNQLHRWVDLKNRSEKYFRHDDQNKGVIANNLALSLHDNGESEEAIKYFNKAISLARKALPQCTNMLIIYLNNLCQTYLEYDLASSLKVFEQVKSIRQKYNIVNDQQISIEYQILARAYYNSGNLEEAIKFIIEAIKQHKSLDYKIRNDYFLAHYHDTISVYYLENKNIRKAILNQKIATNIIEKIGLTESPIAQHMYRKLLALYKYTKNEKKIEFVNDKLKKINAGFVEN